MVKRQKKDLRGGWGVVFFVVSNSNRNQKMNTIKTARLNSTQKAALAAYNKAVAAEDRYLGSVFVTPTGQKEREERTQAAYAACKALGMDYRHGL